VSHRISPSVLREYDIRGTVGRTLHPADAYAVGRSFATRIRRAGGTRVAVGRDGRLSSPTMEAALVEGLLASGVDVVRIGVGPTPMLYFAEATLEVDGGVQVTGSHNPAQDNGFKMMLQGAAFYGEDVQDLARLAAAGDWEDGAGSLSERSVIDDYVARLVAGGGPHAFRIGWDAGNGAAGPVIEKLVKLLPGEHHLLFTDVDGKFPNHHPDPTVESNLADLKRLVVDKRLDFGVAFDGDGDRIGAVDGLGRVVWGDQILSILVEPVLREVPGATIVADVKSSQALFDRIAALGGKPVMWKSGHSVLKAKMKEENAPIAGELSGHIFFGQDYYGFDDAQYAAVRLIRALGIIGTGLTEAREAMASLVTTPELRFPVDPARKAAVVDEVAARLAAVGAGVSRMDGVRVTSAEGWWLLRASNTQDVLVARAEAADEAALARLLAIVDDQLRQSGASRKG